MSPVYCSTSASVGTTTMSVADDGALPRGGGVPVGGGGEEERLRRGRQAGRRASRQRAPRFTRAMVDLSSAWRVRELGDTESGTCEVERRTAERRTEKLDQRPGLSRSRRSR